MMKTGPFEDGKKRCMELLEPACFGTWDVADRGRRDFLLVPCMVSSIGLSEAVADLAFPS